MGEVVGVTGGNGMEVMGAIGWYEGCGAALKGYLLVYVIDSY